MIVYNLLLKLQDSSSENMQEVKELLLSMQGKIDVMHDLKVGVDVRRAATSYDIALSAKFDTMADYEAYLPHPYHMEVATQLKPKVAAMAAVCSEE